MAGGEDLVAKSMVKLMNMSKKGKKREEGRGKRSDYASGWPE